MTVAHLISGAGEIAHHEFLSREPLVQQRFKVSEEVHPLGGRVAYKRDPLAIEQSERQPTCRQRRPGGPRRGLENLAGRLEGVALRRLLFGMGWQTAGEAEGGQSERGAKDRRDGSDFDRNDAVRLGGTSGSGGRHGLILQKGESWTRCFVEDVSGVWVGGISRAAVGVHADCHGHRKHSCRDLNRRRPSVVYA